MLLLIDKYYFIKNSWLKTFIRVDHEDIGISIIDFRKMHYQNVALDLLIVSTQHEECNGCFSLFSAALRKDVGLIIGTIVTALVILVIVIFPTVFILRRRRKNPPQGQKIENNMSNVFLLAIKKLVFYAVSQLYFRVTLLLHWLAILVVLLICISSQL